jgi:hypothetical protein
VHAHVAQLAGGVVLDDRAVVVRELDQPPALEAEGDAGRVLKFGRM